MGAGLGPDLPVRDNCLMEAKGVPNPGREGESERSLVRAQGLSSGKSVGICERGSASTRVYCRITVVVLVAVVEEQTSRGKQGKTQTWKPQRLTDLWIYS